MRVSVGEDSQPQPLRRDASDLVGSGWSGVAMIVLGAVQYVRYKDDFSGS